MPVEWAEPDSSEELAPELGAGNSPDGDIMWGDPDPHEDDDWEVVTPKQEFSVGSGHPCGPPEIQKKRATKPLLR